MIIDVMVGVSEREIDRYDTPELMNVYVRSFNDSYHTDEADIEYRELENEVRNISSRPRRLSEYYRSINIYDAWMDHLYKKYNGKRMFKIMYKNDLVKDYVPSKPRLKSKYLKECAKRGISIAEPSKNDRIDADEIRHQFYEDLGESPEDVIESIEYDTAPMKKKERKLIEKAWDDAFKINKRKKSKLKGAAYASEVNFITEFLSVKHSERYDHPKKKKKGKNSDKGGYRMMLSDFLDADWEKNLERTKNPSDEEMMDYNGILLTQADAEQMNVYKRLAELGWNTYHMMKRAGYSKRQAARIGNKKVKKKKKSKKEKYIDSQVGFVLDDLVSDIGYDSYEEFSMDMLDMTWDHVKDQYRNS